MGRSIVTIDFERQKESTHRPPAFTRHKIISHGQDHHGDSGQDRTHGSLTPAIGSASTEVFKGVNGIFDVSLTGALAAVLLVGTPTTPAQYPTGCD